MVPDCPTAEGSVNGSLTDQHCALAASLVVVASYPPWRRRQASGNRVGLPFMGIFLFFASVSIALARWSRARIVTFLAALTSEATHIMGEIKEAESVFLTCLTD